MTTEKTEEEILELERRFWQAMKDKDAEAAARLTDDACIVTGAQGASRIDRDAFAGMLSDTSWTIEDFEIADGAEVLMPNDDTAIVAYMIREDLTVDGKPVTLRAADASTWVRRDGHWLCALHTESIAGDPFGRDRMPMKEGVKAASSRDR